MATNEARVEIFDPPMCCSTGLCGPTLNPALLDVSEMVLKLNGQGVLVQRHQMFQEPQAFLNNPDVYSLVRERQLEALPITAVDGHIIKVGAYPTLDEVQSALNGDGTGVQNDTLPVHATQGAHQTS
jgi:hypothetical protein